MQLHLGEMSNQEMADWFDTSLKNFYNKKAKKLEELKDFADFHEERGKIIIDEIRIPTYEKHTRKNYNKVKDHFDEVWSETGLDTCAHASE